MRITNNMLVKNVTNNLYKNLARMDKLNKQLSSGKLINLPSDDPVAVARSLSLRTAVSETEQFRKNLADAKSWLEATDSALLSVEEILNRAKELAVKGSNGTLSPEDQQAISYEVDQLIDQLIGIANTSHEGRYIFAGHQTLKEPFTRTGDTISFNGDDGKLQYRIGPGQLLTVNLNGDDIFGANETDPGKIFKALVDLKQNLEAGDGEKISSETLGEIEAARDNLLRYHSELGARMNRVELADLRMSELKINYQQLQSLNEDVDIAEVIMDLKMSETVYRAALATGARVIMPTLMDFLS